MPIKSQRNNNTYNNQVKELCELETEHPLSFVLGYKSTRKWYVEIEVYVFRLFISVFFLLSLPSSMYTCMYAKNVKNTTCVTRY